MNRYRVGFLLLMITLALFWKRWPVQLALIVGAFAFALAKPLWVFILRPIAYYAGMVEPNAHDWEVIAWKKERAGEFEEALEAYNNALMFNLGDQIIWTKRDALIERMKSPDPFYSPPPDESLNQ
jgi:hypothetical protein